MSSSKAFLITLVYQMPPLTLRRTPPKGTQLKFHEIWIVVLIRAILISAILQRVRFHSVWHVYVRSFNCVCKWQAVGLHGTIPVHGQIITVVSHWVYFLMRHVFFARPEKVDKADT